MLGRVNRRLTGAAALAAVLLLAGCSATKAPAAATTTPTPRADLRPWVSLMAKESTELENAKAKLSDASCTPATSDSFACGATYSATAIDMSTIELEVSSATNPSAKGYLGTPPKAIASLYADTEAAAHTATDAGKPWADAKCIGSGSMDCLDAAGTLDAAVGNLATEFSAWGAYS